MDLRITSSDPPFLDQRQCIFRATLEFGGEFFMTLVGKIALVTGGSRGIGFATAERLAREGAVTIISDLRGHEEGAKKLQNLGYQAYAITGDVASDESVAALVDEIVDRFGGIHILVNNAAVASELKPAPFELQDSDLWKRVYDVNVIGTFRACRAVSPHMRAQKWGRIVTVSSSTAFEGPHGMMHYVASKGAVIAMTRSLATELGTDNIVCNAIIPGFTMTEGAREALEIIKAFADFAIASRAIKREELSVDVANAIYFLASSDCAFVTGQTLVVDGGTVYR